MDVQFLCNPVENEFTLENCPAIEYLLRLNDLWNLMELGEVKQWFDDIRPDRLYGWVPINRDVLPGIADSMHIDFESDAPHAGRVAAGMAIITPTQATRNYPFGAYTFAHEIGHLLNQNGLLHTPYEAGTGEDGSICLDPVPLDVDPDYPDYDPQGSIGSWGIRFINGGSDFEIFTPSSNYDFMTYCLPWWISLYNYKKLHEGFADVSNASPTDTTSAAESNQAATSPELESSGKVFIASGIVYSHTRQVDLKPLLVVDSALVPEPGYDGDYCLELYDGDDSLLHQRCFDLGFKHPEEGGTLGVDYFSVVLPYPEGTQAVAVTYQGVELSRISASANAPEVELLSPSGGEVWESGESYTIRWAAGDAEGEELHYSISYSIDGGDTWYPLVLDTTETEWTLVTDDLPGSTNALIRIQASDGFHTTSTVSNASFTVEAKEPHVAIVTQVNGTISIDSPLWLQGYAFDVEDGALDGEALQWHSDLDGPLGTGRQIYTKLSAGQHVVTLTATDRDGDSAAASIEMRVGQTGDDQLETALPEPTTQLPTTDSTFTPWLVGGVVGGAILFGIAFIFLYRFYPSLLPATISGRLLPSQGWQPAVAPWQGWVSIIVAFVAVMVLSTGVALLAYRWSQPDPGDVVQSAVEREESDQNDEGVTSSASATPPAPTELPTMETPIVPSATTTPTPLPPTATPTITPTATVNPGPESMVIGQSVRGLPIEAVRFGTGPNKVIFVGGLHAGFAPGSVALAERTIEHFNQNPQAVPGAVTLYIIKSANPDSLYAPGELSGRLNANGVDLNRNWDCQWLRDAPVLGNPVPGSGGTAPLSEPETHALADFILAQEAKAVVVWAARAIGGLASPGGCDAESRDSHSLAQTYGSAAGYSVANFEEVIVQIVNGDITNWLDQQGIPAITVLLPDYVEVDWPGNQAGTLAVLEAYSN